MTSRPSSISTSSPKGLRGFRRSARGYVARLVGLCAACCLLLGTGGYLALTYGLVEFRHDALVQRQVAEIEAPGFDAEIVMVGDSSLGNGIDAELFSRATGREATNLALIGSFGFAGSANMLERAARRGEVETALIVQTIDMLAREPDPLGDIKSRPTDALNLRDHLEFVRLYFSWDTIAMVVEQSFERFEDDVQSGPETSPAPAAPDASAAAKYEAQNPDEAAFAEDILDARKDFAEQDEINARARQELERLADVCRDHEIHCLYAHGPLLATFCESERDFLAQADAVIRQAGFTLVPGTPLCLPAEKFGDAVDHVAPQFLAESTQAYVDRFLPYLNERATSHDVARQGERDEIFR
jgi:hypothetical protein